MCTRWLALLVFSLGISALLAQPTPPPPNQEQTMQILLDRIQQLEKRVSELEEHERKQSPAQTGTSDSRFWRRGLFRNGPERDHERL